MYTIQHGTKQHTKGASECCREQRGITPSVCERSREQHCPLPRSLPLLVPLGQSQDYWITWKQRNNKGSTKSVARWGFKDSLTFSQKTLTSLKPEPLESSAMLGESWGSHHCHSMSLKPHNCPGSGSDGESHFDQSKLREVSWLATHLLGLEEDLKSNSSHLLPRPCFIYLKACAKVGLQKTPAKASPMQLPRECS